MIVHPGGYLSEKIILLPWEEDSRSLISWYDMLIYSAAQFLWCGGAVRGIIADCNIACAVTADGSAVGFSRGSFIDDMARKKAIESLKCVSESFSEIGLDLSSETAAEAVKELESGSRRNYEWLISQCKGIENLAHKELKKRLFLHIPSERSKFWPTQNEPHPFGAVVASSFPSANYDIYNGAICLACGQTTASVFHLMRTLEVGLGVLGGKFGVSLTHTNWAPALDQIESKIKGMRADPVWKQLPDCKEQQEFYAQAASHFGILKDAWRNHAMHVRGKYTQDEAEQIFSSVKAFMQRLSVKLSE